MDNFADIIKKWTEETATVTDTILQDIVMIIGRAVVRLSPVDTGRFKGNWQLSINTGSDMSLLREDTSGGVTISDMITTVRTFTAGEVAYIQNHVLYGYDLEHGSSAQARDPDGMVRVTAARFTQIVAQAVANNAT